MDLNNFATMDTALLYSIVNMKLRNDYAGLEDLCRSLDIDCDGLQRRLASAGYTYQASLNQFRQSG